MLDPIKTTRTGDRTQTELITCNFHEDAMMVMSENISEGIFIMF